MVNGEEVVGGILKHYASRYYDPVKAREYYLKTRELKGRAPGKLDAKQKEAWRVSESNINTEKESATDAAVASQKARMENLRGRAKETVDKISKELDDYLAKADEAIANELAKVDAQKNKELPLNKIPATASPKVKAFLEAQNRSIRNGNNAQVVKVSAASRESARKIREQATEKRRQAAEQKKKLREDLSAALKTAREEYKAGREALKARYESIKNTEFNNIQSQLK